MHADPLLLELGLRLRFCLALSGLRLCNRRGLITLLGVRLGVRCAQAISSCGHTRLVLQPLRQSIPLVEEGIMIHGMQQVLHVSQIGPELR